MTGNSILFNTLKGIKQHRPPVWLMRQAGRTLPRYMKLREKYSFNELILEPELIAQVTLMPVSDLGVDAAILFSDILVVPQAAGMKLNFTDKGPVFDSPLKDCANPAKELKPDISYFQNIFEAIGIINSEKPADIPLIGFCGAPFTVFCYMMQGKSTSYSFYDAIKFFYSQPQETERIFDIITELTIHYAREQIKHGVDVFQLFESHAGLLPSDIYEERVLPFIKKIATAVRKTGTPLIFFSKGASAGYASIDDETADCVGIDWQTSLWQARRMIDENIGLQGNFDPRILLTNTKTISSHLEKFTSFGEHNHNWIFNLGHGLLPETPLENIIFLIDWIKTNNWNR
ncbi:MAG: uroporphyrinogen decarboxylase [Bacteroidetes bacterium]|nr:uroporphyrinogen decarboxylase [Bacteroidota bacterium]MBU1717862.1 uroporphyrinogen decarboxylase [Bacteroidota bacterium]